MADNGMPALNTVLKRGDGASPEVFTAIAELTDINGLDLKMDVVEITHLTNAWKERKGTLLDAGEIKISGNFIPTDTTQRFATSGLGLDLVNKTLRNFKLVFPDGGSTTWTFTALVIAFSIKAPLAGKLGFDATILISGLPTFA